MRDATDKRAAAGAVAAFTLLVSGIWLAWGALSCSSDVYYMIAEGRHILEHGFDGLNAFTWQEGCRLPVQNWACCAAMALLEKLCGGRAAYVFYSAVAAASFAVPAWHLSKKTGSGLAGSVIALAAWLPVNASFLPLRPENVTMLTTFLSYAALDGYARTGRARYLAWPPVLVALEMNLHAAMWPVHFCILAALLVPGIPWMPFRDDPLKGRRKGLAACGAAMAAATLLNPYGTELVMYPLHTLRLFKLNPITEQSSPPIASYSSLMVVAIVLLLAWCLQKKRMAPYQAHLAAGFAALAAMKPHGLIFLPIAAACFAGAMADGRAARTRQGPSPEDVRKIARCVAALGAVLAACAWTAVWRSGGLARNLSGISGYIAQAREDGAANTNVFAFAQAGSLLEYDGITGIMSDGRLEALYGPVNGAGDFWRDMRAMDTGYRDGAPVDAGEYLDANGIGFVVDDLEHPRFPYLMGWLSGSGGWRVADCEGSGSIVLWERTGTAGQR